MARASSEPDQLDERGSLVAELPHLATLLGGVRAAISAGGTEPLISVLAKLPHRPYSRGERATFAFEVQPLKPPVPGNPFANSPYPIPPLCDSHESRPACMLLGACLSGTDPFHRVGFALLAFRRAF